jgi:hypothetical protein
MYAFLLILGTVIAAAGVVLIGPGLPFGGRDYDPSIVTPGAVAIVGGLILIGLALAVRVLGRIEKALAARPLPHPVLQEEVATPAVEEPAAAAPARIPFPPKPVAEPAPPPAPAVATARVLPEDAALERLREKFPTLVRLENAPVVEDADVSLSPKPSVRADEAVAETNDTVAYRTNGAAPARIEPRLEVQARPASRPERAKNFEAFWPKKQRPRREAQAPAAPQPTVQQPAAPALPAEPLLTPEPVQFQFREPAPELRPVAPAPMASAPMAPAPEAQATITILKSGVVDGMAYTLYSDGSIEAQLPQGTLRFGSITELRNHIEQSA